MRRHCRKLGSEEMVDDPLRKFRQFAAGLLFAACALSVHAADLAMLRNGYEIRHEAREVVGENTRLYLNADRTGGYIDVKSDQIVGFEQDQSVRTAAVPAPV